MERLASLGWILGLRTHRRKQDHVCAARDVRQCPTPMHEHSMPSLSVDPACSVGSKGLCQLSVCACLWGKREGMEKHTHLCVFSFFPNLLLIPLEGRMTNISVYAIVCRTYLGPLWPSSVGLVERREVNTDPQGTQEYTRDAYHTITFCLGMTLQERKSV